MLWWKKSWAVRTRQQYGSQFATPLNVILSYRKQWQICRHLKAIGWHLKTETEVWIIIHRLSSWQCLVGKDTTKPPFIWRCPNIVDWASPGIEWSVNYRLRVVPHLSSGIVEQAKRERARENHPTREKTTRGGEREKCDHHRVWKITKTTKNQWKLKQVILLHCNIAISL